MARSYLDWGKPLKAAKLGAIAVLTRGSDSGQGHVGFVVGEVGNRLFLLGGNQQNAVSVQSFETSKLLGLRWPEQLADQKLQDEGIFEAALAHVMEMEGGWSNDPYDPGGPTNMGITLAVYAAVKNVKLTDSNRDALIGELKKIKMHDIRPIYLERYWIPSKANKLPPGLALMHFDAAVNHGVGNAARMLQQALGVTIDGEIGPQTLGAAHSQSPVKTVRHYADIRRARYRSLPHFWRFGRGWLRRVDRTLAAAIQLNGKYPILSRSNTGDKPVSKTDELSGSGKWWGHSITVWGAIIAAASTVLPAIGPLFGIDITPDLVNEFGEHVTAAIQALGGLIGVVMAIYGRMRATTPLERRRITMQL